MINLFKVSMSDRAINEVGDVLNSGMIGEGPKVEKFKRELKKRFNCDYLTLLNSGTSAITLALRLAGVEGGEVITTSFTMIATNVAIKAAGAIPVFADIESDSVQIDWRSIKTKITKKTKAIVIVLVGGHIPHIPTINSYGIPVIIDASHAVDTYYQGKHISLWGDFVCFSFQSIKQLTTGDGGALVCKTKKDYDRAEKLKWFGMSRIVPEGMTRLEHQMTADVEEWGYKMHMNDISAAIGLANLDKLNFITKQQQENAKFYCQKLRGIKGITLPMLYAGVNASYWAFYIFVDRRKDFMEHMTKKGIETTPMWRRNDEYSCFEKADLPNMTKVQDKIVFIPVGWWLKKTEVEYIYDCIVHFYTT